MKKKLTKKQILELEAQVEKDNKSIARNNAKFAKMSAPEQRVQIARDVIAQLASKRLVATPGIWLSGKNEGDLWTDKDIEKDVQLQDVLKKRKTCEGCALGGMFMCAVERTDKLKMNELIDPYSGIEEEDTVNYLSRFFDDNQLHMIESAFERGEGAHATDEESVDFVRDVEGASERMRLIMENIIVHDGEFNPEFRPLASKWVTPGFKS